MKRRGFLARVAAVLAAPFVPRETFDLERAKRDVLYFLDATKLYVPVRHGKSHIGYLHHVALMSNQMPRAHAIITDLRDPEEITFRGVPIEPDPQLRARVEQTTRDLGAYIDKVYTER
jgi:hypothetical protein